MRPEYKGTPKLCREPDGVQLGMRAFSHALVIKSAPVHKDSGCQGSGHSCQAQHLPHGSLLTTPLPGLSPLHGTFAPVLSKAGMQAHPVIFSFVGLVLTRPVRILLSSLAVSPAYIRMNEKRLQREKELLENCELDFLAQKTIPHQQFRTEVPGKMTDAPVLGFLRT